MQREDGNIKLEGYNRRSVIQCNLSMCVAVQNICEQRLAQTTHRDTPPSYCGVLPKRMPVKTNGRDVHFRERPFDTNGSR